MPNSQSLLLLASATKNSNGQSEDFPTSAVDRVHLDINVSAITGSVTFTYSRKGHDGNYFQVWSGTLGNTGSLSANIGHGLEVNKEPGMIGQLSWTLAGSGASVTFSASANGK